MRPDTPGVAPAHSLTLGGVGRGFGRSTRRSGEHRSMHRWTRKEELFQPCEHAVVHDANMGMYNGMVLNESETCSLHMHMTCLPVLGASFGIFLFAPDLSFAVARRPHTECCAECVAEGRLK